MAPTQTQSSKLFTRDVAAFSDTELDRFLKANAGSVEVEDPENVKKDEVLLQRLRARAGGQSRPIDLDDLTARLEAASANRDAPPQQQPSILHWKLVDGRYELVPLDEKSAAQREAFRTGIDENGNKDPNYRSRDTTEPLDEEEEYRRGLEEETEHYNTLVSEGGRPSHPLGLLGQDIFENPGEYREILSYWLTGPGLPIQQDLSFNLWAWKVFRSQLCEWHEFREYQRAKRAKKEGYFLEYCERVQERLARHGFERPFQLHEDLDQQDKLATWIEFLNYEYQDYDKDMRFVESNQSQYDAAWKELVDSRVLRPSETEEFICNIKSVFQHASEEERAEKALESAKSAVISAQNAIIDPRRFNLSEKEAQRRLTAAQVKLDTAVKSLDSIKRRDDLVYEFYKKTQLSQVTNDGKRKRSYQSAKDDVKRRSILLRWILKQIPLIELELNQSKMAANDSGGEDGRNRLKRHPADDLNEERVSKRRREDRRTNALSKRKTRAFIAPTSSQDSSTQRPSQTAGHERQLKRTVRAIKRPRDSGQKTSNTAEPISIGEPLSIELEWSNPDNSAAQVPKSRIRQARVYQKERESRRIAGQSPQFGMLPKRGELAPPYEPLSRYPSNTRKSNPSSLRSHASSKKPIAVKGTRPQGKSGRFSNSLIPSKFRFSTQTGGSSGSLFSLLSPETGLEDWEAASSSNSKYSASRLSISGEGTIDVGRKARA